MQEQVVGDWLCHGTASYLGGVRIRLAPFHL